MAARKINNSHSKNKTKRSSQGKADSSQSEKSKGRQELNPTIKTEVIILAVLAFSILLALSIFTESIGAFGGFIKTVLYGIFGVGASVLPFAVILGCVFAGFKKFRKSSRLKNSLMCILFLAFISIFHVMYLREAKLDANGPIEYIAYFAKNGGISNGGAIGAIIGGSLVKIIGVTGAYVFLGALAIISVVIITERSIFELLSSAAVKTAGAAKKLNNGRKRLSRRMNPGVRSPSKAQDESVESLRRKLTIDDRNFNHELKWDEVSEFESMSYEDKAKFVEENPEIFGFSKELDIPEILNTVETKEPLDNNTEDAQETKAEEGIETQSESQPDYEDDRAIIIEDYDEREVGVPSDEDKPPFDMDDSKNEREDAAKISDFLKRQTAASSAATDAEKIVSSGISNEFIDYVFPPLELLQRGENGVGRDTKAQMLRNAQKLEDTLKSFGVIAKVVQINKGPTVTRYELTPDSGVKVSRIVGLADDIALNLASDGIRIEAPVPGKSVVGIEVPNRDRTPVYLREVLEATEFQKFESKVAFGVGKDIGGSAIVADISDMPHLLIAGATGAGKSVCINTLITSVLYKASPNEVKLILIDPKVVELGIYDGIPHLLTPVVTSPKEAASALNWGVHEMNNRYNLFKEENVRDLKGYNNSKAERFEFEAILPKIIIIIDELSDLMMSAPKDVEDSIMRLAQKARAAGIHLVLATQRPSVDVITGVIKANIPSRLAFAVSSGTDSRTILDMVGAEKLLGRGDMLFSPRDLAKPVRVQGAFVSDKEVENIVSFIKQHSATEYDEQVVAEITTAVKAPVGGGVADDGGDDLYDEVLEFVLTKKEISVSMLQRQFRIGYNRSARLVDTLEKNGVVSENTAEGTGKPSRRVLANHGGD